MRNMWRLMVATSLTKHTTQPPHDGKLHSLLPQAFTTKSFRRYSRLVVLRGACRGWSCAKVVLSSLAPIVQRFRVMADMAPVCLCVGLCMVVHQSHLVSVSLTSSCADLSWSTISGSVVAPKVKSTRMRSSRPNISSAGVHGMLSCTAIR